MKVPIIYECYIKYSSTIWKVLQDFCEKRQQFKGAKDRKKANCIKGKITAQGVMSLEEKMVHLLCEKQITSVCISINREAAFRLKSVEKSDIIEKMNKII